MWLFAIRNLNPQGTVSYNGVTVPVILCHQDSYQLGLGSNHGDVLHWFPKFGKTMQDVRNDVAALMGETASTPTVDNDVTVSYQAKVTAKDGLNCRTTPVSGSVVTTYPNGMLVQISKERNGWGYTGIGWVSLAYVEKVSQQIQEEDEDMTLDKFKELMKEYRAELQDNDCGTWSAEAREWAISTGMINGVGNDANGNPNYAWADTLTREQAAALFYRFAKLMGRV